jgi:hypothetical protein
MSNGQKYPNLWDVVRELILAHHEQLNQHRIRESYYLIRDMLSPLIGTRIAKDEFFYFAKEKQAYSTYRDDVWPAIEKKHGIQRPEAKPYGTIYDNGTEYPISRLEEIWEQARGFIFTEKLEDGEDLRKLSDYGWTIIAGGGFGGFPTRQIRQLLKDDDRQILAFHDLDIAGNGIWRALGFETRRTSHLDIALGDRVIDLGLMKEDVEILDLPIQPEPPKYRGEMRAETSGLAVLEKRMGIKDYKLAYVVAKMLALGVTLSPTERSKEEILRFELEYAVGGAFDELISSAVESAMSEIDTEGTAVSLDLGGAEDIIDEELEKRVLELAIELGRDAEWSYENDYHQRAMKLASPKLIKLLESKEASP